MKRFEIVSYDKENLRVDYRFIGTHSTEAMVQLGWRGSVSYYIKQIFHPSDAVLFISTGRYREIVDVLDVRFIGIDWEENYRLEANPDPDYDYSKCPIIESPPGDYTSGTYQELFIDRIYENSFADVDPGDVVVDIGANIGLFAMYANEKNAKEVYCFEPVEKTYRYFKINTHNLKNVKGFNKGVSGVAGTKFLLEDFLIYGSAGSMIVEDETKATCTIECVTINDIIKDNSLDRIDYLKIDCEGPELEILQSIDADTFRMINKIVVECHTPEITQGTQELLMQNGFTFETLPNMGVKMIYAKNSNFQPRTKSNQDNINLNNVYES